MPLAAWVYPDWDVSAEPPFRTNVNVSDVSRSLAVNDAVTSEKLSSPDVSVKVSPDIAARLGSSFAPAIVAVRFCDAVAVPSEAVKVKLSVCCEVSASMALSFGMYL